MTVRSIRRSDRGQVLPVFALLLIGIMTMVAIVIDLGHLRETKRTASRVADLAALAAGPSLAKGDAVSACNAAFTYLKTNTPDLPSAAVADCSGMPALGACVPTTEHTAAVTGASPYTVTIRYPVANTDPAINNTQFSGGTGEQDGQPCERLLVTMKRQNPTFFAGVIGKKNLTTQASAIVRVVSGAPSLTPTLWLLDPHSCGVAGALEVSGGAALSVGQLSPPVPGIITLDSDGSGCSGSQTTINTNGFGSVLAAIPPLSASINLFAMPLGATSCSGSTHHDCASPLPASISPQPIPLAARATRAPVDWIYNCKTGYPPFIGEITINDCPKAGTIPHYIDDLVSAVGVAPSTPTGFTPWTYGCSPSTQTFPVGNYYISCANFTVNGSANLVFAGGNVIFDGNVTVTSGSLSFNTANTGTLGASCSAATWNAVSCIQTSSSNASFVYLRNGNLSANGTGVTFSHTFLYQAQPSPGNNSVTVDGTAAPSWTPPSTGPFANLSLWSEGSAAYKLAGNGTWNVPGGIFFTPLAQPFKIAGSSGLVQTSAQFIAYDLRIDGSAAFSLTPPGSSGASTDIPRYQLIR